MIFNLITLDEVDVDIFRAILDYNNENRHK